MGGRLTVCCLAPWLLGAVGTELPPPFEIPTCRYTVDPTGTLVPHVHEDADSDARWWLEPRCPVGASCMPYFAQLSAPDGAAAQGSRPRRPAAASAADEVAALRGPCDLPRYRPAEVDSPERIIRIMAKGEPFIISDLKAPDASHSASSTAKANADWQTRIGPSALSVQRLKEVLGPRRLVAPQCTVANGTSFSNFKGSSQEHMVSSACAMAWEHVVDGIFLEKPLPVAARFLEGHRAGGQDLAKGAGSSGELAKGSEDEVIVRAPVKLQKRLQFKDAMNLVKPIMEGIPKYIWGGWDFVEKVPSLLFLASRETRTPLHKDGFSAVVVQLNGTKHWTVIPDEAREQIAKLPGGRIWRRGPLGLEEPLRTKLKARTCLLRPLEVLYMPGSYWHDVYSLTAGASLSVRLGKAFEQILRQQRAAAR